MDMNLSKLQEIVEDRGDWHAIHLRIWTYLEMGSLQMELVEITGVLRRGKRQVEKVPM